MKRGRLKKRLRTIKKLCVDNLRPKEIPTSDAGAETLIEFMQMNNFNLCITHQTRKLLTAHVLHLQQYKTKKEY